MSAPEKVRLKRKRTEEPPTSLLLTRAIDEHESTPQKRICYRIQHVDEHTFTPAKQTSLQRPVKRLFHLRRGLKTNNGGNVTSQSTNAVPVFQEQRIDTNLSPMTNVKEYGDTGSDAQPTKRPGRGSALKKTDAATIPKPVSNVQALADSMHQFALDELSQIPKPVSKSRPRMSPAQAKSRHEQIVASNQSSPKSATNEDMMDVDDVDFVYDTYILSTNDDLDDVSKESVGFLVIHEDDEEYWQSLLEQDEAEQLDVDEEDENAEDHYAADYPEDELASDDEYDQNAYNYRPRAGSDVEQWDHRHGSDDDELDPYAEKVAMVKRWEEELGIRRE